MLDLNARIELEEIELGSRIIDEELDRARGPILDQFAEPYGCRAHAFAELGIAQDERRRRFLEDFLLPSLHGAFALAAVDDRPFPIAENLNFDVAGLHQVAQSQHTKESSAAAGSERRKRTFGMYFSTKTPPFEKSVYTAEKISYVDLPIRSEDGARPKAHLTEVDRRLESLLELVLAPADAHPHSASATGRLEDDGIADSVGLLEGGLDGRNELTAREDRYVGGDGASARFVLETHRLDLFRGRSEPDDACILDLASKVLWQESMSRVQHLENWEVSKECIRCAN